MKTVHIIRTGADLQKGQAVINQRQSTSFAQAAEESAAESIKVVRVKPPLPPAPGGNLPQLPAPAPKPERGPSYSKIDRLRWFFLTHPNAWIPMPELSQVCDAYVIHSMAATLRKDNRMVIDCRVLERIGNGEKIKCSEYRYRPDYRYVFVETPEGARKRAAVPRGSIVETSTVEEGQ